MYFCLFVCVYFCLFVCVYFCLFVCLCVFLFVCLFVVLILPTNLNLHMCFTMYTHTHICRTVNRKLAWANLPEPGERGLVRLANGGTVLLVSN